MPLARDTFVQHNHSTTTMKNTFLAIVAIITFAGMANAQLTSSATATANARIICPLAITHTSGQDNELNFGCLINNGGGTATMTNAGLGVLTTTPNLYSYTGTNGGCNLDFATGAVFHLTGEVGFSYNAVASDPSGAGWSVDLTYNNDINAGNVVNDLSAGVNNTILGENEIGCSSYVVHVGGTLSVMPGFYGTINSPFTVTVQYN
jgi:hypothetical protein